VDGKEIYPDEAEGFVGKTVVLGAGYQTGGAKLQITLKAATPPMDMPLEECTRIINTYRNTYTKIPLLWKQGEKAIQAMHDNHGMWLGKEGVLWVDGKKGIKLPNGLYISYPSLHQYDSTMNGRPVKKWRYKDEKGFQDIYGGKLIENVVQALARIIVMLQLLKISKRYTVPLTVHDSVVAIARVEESDEALAYIEECMRWIPKWARGCPINCEAFMGANYGEC
jgi:DNA polymerase